MLRTPAPDRALEDLWELGILHHVIPELAACKGVAQPADYHREGDVWEHLLACTRALTPEDDGDIRLAALLHDVGKPKTFSVRDRIRFDEHASVSGEMTKEILQRLQCPAVRRDKIAWLVSHHMMMGTFVVFPGHPDHTVPPERRAHWYYHPWFTALLRIFEIDIAGTTPANYNMYKKIVQDYHAFLDAHPRPEKALLSGNEIMEILGIGQGERVGEILQALAKQRQAGTITTKKEARAFLENLRS
jgi:poly(A) polymerase